VSELPVHHLVIEAGGHRFEGTVIVDMPLNQRRVVDYINRPEAFSCCAERTDTTSSRRAKSHAWSRFRRLSRAATCPGCSHRWSSMTRGFLRPFSVRCPQCQIVVRLKGNPFSAADRGPTGPRRSMARRNRRAAGARLGHPSGSIRWHRAGRSPPRWCTPGGTSAGGVNPATPPDRAFRPPPQPRRLPPVGSGSVDPRRPAQPHGDRRAVPGPGGSKGV